MPEPERRSRVLVTYGWCRTAYAAVKALAARGHEVFTCDSNSPAIPSSVRVRSRSGTYATNCSSFDGWNHWRMRC